MQSELVPTDRFYVKISLTCNYEQLKMAVLSPLFLSVLFFLHYYYFIVIICFCFFQFLLLIKGNKLEHEFCHQIIAKKKMFKAKDI